MKKSMILPVLYFCLTACKSSPDAVPPEWVNKPPQADSLYEYFSATGSSCGSHAEHKAYQYAMEAIALQLSRYLGSSITLTTETTKTATAGETRIEAQTNIRENAAAYIKHCKVIETFIRTKEAGNDCISVSVLVQYDKTALAAEQARLATLTQEKQRAIDLPEKEADRYALEGRPYKALLRYIEAAAAAARSGLDNADLKYERNIEKARKMLTHIKMEAKSSTFSTAICNQPFPSSFIVRLYTDITDEKKALAEAPVLINYTNVHPRTGRKSLPLQKIVSAADGNAVFIHPIQSRPYENGQVVFTLNTDAILAPLRNLSGRYKNAVRLLEEAAALCRIHFSYKVIDSAKE